MAGEAIWVDNTEIICETAASSSSMSDGAIRECDSDDLQPTDVDGYPSAWAEFDTAAARGDAGSRS